MILSELKAFLDTLSPDQLTQQAIVFLGDDEQGHEIDSWDVSGEDIYWETHGDCLGPLEVAKESIGEDWENEKDDLVIVPKGVITFFTL